ncbi:MAG: hypothetical protein SPF91_08075 [Clostridium sp.]|nr:hypothetical protein [Clostridium sp.]
MKRFAVSGVIISSVAVLLAGCGSTTSGTAAQRPVRQRKAVRNRCRKRKQRQ